MSLKIRIIRVLLLIIGFFQGEKYKYSQEYEDNFKYMGTAEKVWWGYKSIIRQAENGEKGKHIEEYFANQNLEYKREDSFNISSSVTITAAGDLNSSESIYPENTKHLFDDIEDFLFSGDIVCANLESPLDPSKPIGAVPSMCLTAPELNTTPEMLERFTRGGKGINLFATANNHSVDQGESGLVATLDFLDSKGYTKVGTSRTPEEQMDIPVIEKNGIRIAFLSYTYCLNGHDPIEGKEYMTNVIRLNKLDTDLSLIKKHVEVAHKKNADIIVGILHWSVEFESYPLENVIKMGHRVMECGVEIILGGHPHVSQPMEKYRYFDTYAKKEKEGFIVYSLGDFVAYNAFTKNSRITTVLKLEVSKGIEGNETTTKITDLKVLPVYICAPEYKDAITDFRLLNFRKIIKQLEKGENPNGFNEKRIKELKRLEVLLYNKILPADSSKIIAEA